MNTREKIRQYRRYQADESELEESNRLRSQRQNFLPALEGSAVTLLVTPDIEQEPWPEPFAETVEGRIIAIGGLARGTSDGKPAVLVRASLSDGRIATVQIALEEFIQAADAVWLRFGRTQQFSP